MDARKRLNWSGESEQGRRRAGQGAVRRVRTPGWQNRAGVRCRDDPRSRARHRPARPRADFEADLLQAAATVLPQLAGFVEFTGHGCGIERPPDYLFTIRWETIEDHLEGFRGGELFGLWRS